MMEIRAEALVSDCLRPPPGGWHGSGQLQSNGKISRDGHLNGICREAGRKNDFWEKSSDVIQIFCDVTIICSDSWLQNRIFHSKGHLKFYSRPRPLAGGKKKVRRRQSETSVSALTLIQVLGFENENRARHLARI